MSKVAIFVDVQNIYYTTRQIFGHPFNYRAFVSQLQQREEICFAHAYAIESNNDGQRKFQDALRHMGFEVKLKPYIQRSDGSAKGDWDVGITIDVMEIAPQVEKVILLSGDGDFDLLLQRIRQRYSVKTEVVSVAALTAQSLIQSSDSYTPIEERHLIT